MHHDAIVIGGGFAGLAAATYLARARRSVCVVDSGRPRNRYAAASHGFLSRDGSSPLALLGIGREQVEAYPTVRMVSGEATTVRIEGSGFAVTLGDGSGIAAAKLILAFGLHDMVPEIAGLAERWGKSVLHCPYCHGLAFSDRQLGVLYRMPMSAHQALLVAEWGPTTLYLNGAALDDESRSKLEARGIGIEPRRITRLLGKGDALEAVELEGGAHRAVEALYIAPESRLGSPVAAQLGCAIEDGILGPMIRTDADRMTTVPGVYAAGDIARAPHSVSWAVADGVTAGTAAHRALVFG